MSETVINVIYYKPVFKKVHWIFKVFKVKNQNMNPFKKFPDI